MSLRGESSDKYIKMHGNTLIKDILFEKSRLQMKAFILCAHYNIKTAEQLETYNRFAFRTGGSERKPLSAEIRRLSGKKTMDYLEECLKRANLSFAPEPPEARGRWTPLMIYGRENAKDSLLKEMQKINDWRKRDSIADLACKNLNDHLEPYGGYDNFAKAVFGPTTVWILFKELLKEGRIKKYKGSGKVWYRTK